VRCQATQFNVRLGTRNYRKILIFDRVALVALQVQERLSTCLDIAVRQSKSAFGHYFIFVASAEQRCNSDNRA
jgi:hypothetical protein